MSPIKKVLVVDDSAQMNLAYKMILSRYRCEIIEALNGQDGLHKLANSPGIDVMIIDINMPLMSGLEFVRAVKEQKRFDHIPVIVASTTGKEKEAEECLALGANSCIKKPFTSSELHAHIEKLFPEVKNRV